MAFHIATSTLSQKTLSAGISSRDAASRSLTHPSLTVSIKSLPSQINAELNTRVFCLLTRCLHMDYGKINIESRLSVTASKQDVLTRRRRLYATVTFHPSRELHRKIIGISAGEVEGFKATENLTTSIVVQALHINSIKAMKERAGNALGDKSDGPLLSESLMPTICGGCGSGADQPTCQQLHS